jgi:hypothetical protein
MSRLTLALALALALLQIPHYCTRSWAPLTSVRPRPRPGRANQSQSRSKGSRDFPGERRSLIGNTLNGGRVFPKEGICANT